MRDCLPLLNRPDRKHAETFDLPQTQGLILLAEDLESAKGLSLSTYKSFWKESIHFFIK